MTPEAGSLAEPIVLIGGGHAAAALCGALAEAGQGHRVHLVCAEALLPYHRPPLSKAYLKNPADAPALLRPDAWYAQVGIQVHRADPALRIDRAAHQVVLRSGKVLPYGKLVLATGARARHLPGLPDGLENVMLLRTAADAEALRARLSEARSLTVLGGGFIGLEVAATARALGLAVTVLEAAPRLLMRAVSAELAAHVRAHHEAAGTALRFGVRVDAPEPSPSRLISLRVDGERLPVDLLLLGIGAEPDTALAEAAGLAVDDGVRVDASLRSSDPEIFAIGDCARFTRGDGGAPLRLESVQNANDQGRTVAANLLGEALPYRAVPWFWSEQGSLRLQMAGLLPAEAHSHRRPGAQPNSFSILHYAGDRLACVESVNAPMDHLAARKLLETGVAVPPERACDPAVPLKSLA